MTPKKQVKSAHKNAWIKSELKFGWGGPTVYYVVSGSERIGSGESEYGAWADAASKLNQSTITNN